MVGPLVLITLGVLFLLNNLYPGFEFSRMWPVILIVIGFVKITDYFQHPRGEGTPRGRRGRHSPLPPPMPPPPPQVPRTPPSGARPAAPRTSSSAAPAGPGQSSGYSGAAGSPQGQTPGGGTSAADPEKEGTS